MEITFQPYEGYIFSQYLSEEKKSYNVNSDATLMTVLRDVLKISDRAIVAFVVSEKIELTQKLKHDCRYILPGVGIICTNNF